MNTDIRLKVGFFQNPKVRKLRKLHGADAVLALQELWLFTAEHRPDGILHDMDADDIDAVCGQYTERILDVFVALKFVVLTDGVYSIHQWAEHQPWAVSARIRSENARMAVTARWSKSKQKDAYEENTERIRGVYEENTGGNTPILSLPYQKTKAQQPAQEEIEELIKTYREHIGLASLPPVKKFAQWLAEGKTVSQIESAIIGAGGYPPPSRAALVIRMVEDPKKQKAEPAEPELTLRQRMAIEERERCKTN